MSLKVSHHPQPHNLILIRILTLILTRILTLILTHILTLDPEWGPGDF
jgi:hypothetical protein